MRLANTRPIRHQRGAGIIAAIAAITIFSLLGASLNQMHQSSTRSTTEQHTGSDAFIAAEAGLLAATYTLQADCPPTTLPFTLTGTIGGDGYRVTVSSDGGTGYNFVSTGSTPAVNPNQTRTLSRAGFTCATTGSGGGSPVAGGAKLDIEEDTTINGNCISYQGQCLHDDYDGDELNTINESGVLSSSPITVPPLSPSRFPSTGRTDLEDPSSVDAGSYDEIKEIRGSATFTGGDYFIDKLETKENAVLYLYPGRYFIEELKLKKGTTIHIVDDPSNPDAVVEIFIKDKFEMEKNARINSDTVDEAHDVARLQVHLYDDAELKLKKDGKFTGLIYGHGEDSKIEFEKDNEFVGAINSEGEVKIKKGNALTFNEYVISALGGGSTPGSSGTWAETTN